MQMPQVGKTLRKPQKQAPCFTWPLLAAAFKAGGLPCTVEGASLSSNYNVSPGNDVQLKTFESEIPRKSGSSN